MKIYAFSGLGSSLIPTFRETLLATVNRVIRNSGLETYAAQFVWKDWEDALEDIYLESLNAQLAGEPFKLVLIGHSQGVKACCELAEALNDLDIEVEYLISLDSTLSELPPIDSNVKIAHDFQANRGWVNFFRSTVLRNRGKLHLADSSKTKLTSFEIDANHFNIGLNSTVFVNIKFIMDRIKNE